MSVKTYDHGQQTRDKRRGQIRRTDKTEGMTYLQNFCEWLKNGKNSLFEWPLETNF